MAEQPTVLVIDDEDSIQKLLKHALEREGYRVVAAGDAAGGLDAFERDDPDVVLLDVMLPDVSGREVCRRLRAVSNVPIIMLTALDDEVDKVVGLELGADDYITKPFGMRELRVPRAGGAAPRGPPHPQRGGRPRRATAWSAPASCLDRARRTVTANGEPVQLTYVEFEILETLLASPGRVFSRSQLLDSVWGSSDFREPRTVDVHIRHLREKIEHEPSEPELLLTVRGVGYRFAG